VIKIEQHPSPIKGKVLDRSDIDMAGCIECALCVEACPFRAITMAPDFEMVATFDRTTDLVFDMYELRIAGTAEIDAGMEHIQGVKRGLRGQAAPAAAPARPAAPARAAVAAAAPAAAAPAAVAAPAAPAPAPAPAVAPAPAPAAAAPANYDPLTISDEDMKKLPASDRAAIYHARLRASGWTPPAAKA
jgi:ferredoxin